MRFLSRELSWANILVSVGISVFLVFGLLALVDWRESFSEITFKFNRNLLVGLLALTFALVLTQSARWFYLLGGKVTFRTATLASVIGLGGNMLLPARGGDLAKVLFSSFSGNLSWTIGIGRLLIEKLLDLGSIILLGFLVLVLFYSNSYDLNVSPLSVGVFSLIVLVVGSLIVKARHRPTFVHIFRPLEGFGWFSRVRQKIKILIADLKNNLSPKFIWKPAVISISMWLLIYAPSYMLIADAVGSNLRYHETILILAAAVAGLMLPAAPSGIGTFHASVVTAFAFIGKPLSEGLIVGAAIHLFFFTVFALPGLVLYGLWFLKKSKLQK